MKIKYLNFKTIKEFMLGSPFPRPLNYLGIVSLLDPKKKASDSPRDLNRVLRLNSSFLELTDSTFVKQGWILFSLCIVSFAFVFLFGFACYLLFSELFMANSAMENYSLFQNTFNMVLLGILLIFSGIMSIATTNIFIASMLVPGTHTAIRFCRKNFRVYGFIRSVPFYSKNPRFFNAAWEDTHFYLRRSNYELYPKGSGEYEWDLVMVELNTDGDIINEIHLDRVMGSDNRDLYLLGQWEMIRRYMEEGPQSFPVPKVMLPIAFRRETFWEGWLVVYRSQTDPMLLFFAILGFLLPFPGFSRVLHKWIAKVPKWPDDVLTECDIDPNDTYRYEGGKNGTVIHYPTLNPIK